MTASAVDREHWVKARQDAGNPYRFVVSTEDVDRMGDVIEASGWRLANFKKNPIALWQHDHRSPIGVWDDIAVEDGKLVATLRMAAHGTSPFINTVRSLIEQRILRACSVGFRALKVEPLEGTKNGGLRFKEQELLEISVVSVPANQNALATAKSFGLSADDYARLFAQGEAASTPRSVQVTERGATSGASPATSETRRKSGAEAPTMNGPFTQRINALEAELGTLNDELLAATKALDEKPDDEAVSAQHDGLIASIDQKQKTLNALREANARLATKSQPVGGADQQQQRPGLAAPAIVTSHPSTKNLQGGDLIFKMATANFLAFATKKSVNEIVEERYPGLTALKAVMDIVTRTAVHPATTTATGWAAELVQNDVRGFLETLRENSVAAALALRSTMLDFGGFNSITVPRRNPLPAGQSEPAWVGEAGVIPLTSFSFGAATINRYKLAAISTFSREIAERSTPAIEGLIRSALSEAYAQVLDNALLSATAAVAGVRPAGLLNGVVVAAGTAGGGDAAVRADLKAMLAAMLAARTGSRPVLLLNSVDRLSVSLMTTALGEEAFADQLSSGRLLGFEVVSSGHVPQGTAVMVDAAALATAFDAPMFDVSDVATVTEANADGTAPTQATGAAGAVGTAGQVPADGGIRVAQQAAAGAAAAGYTARSLWQTYSVGIRMVAPTSWAVLRPGSVQAANGLTW